MNKTKSFFLLFVKKYRANILSQFFFLRLPFIILFTFGVSTSIKTFVDNVADMSLIVGIISVAIYSATLIAFPLYTAILKKVNFKFKYKLGEDIKNYLFQYIFKHSNDFFNNNQIGYINTQINNVSKNTYSFIDGVMEVSLDVLMFIIIAVLCYMITPFLGLFFVGWCAIYIVVFTKMTKLQAKKQEEVSKSENITNAKIVDCLTNISSIRDFCKEHLEKFNIRKNSVDILRKRDKEQQISAISDLVNFTMIFLVLFVIFFTLLLQLKSGIISIGTFLAVFGIASRVRWKLIDVINRLTDSSEKYVLVKQGIEFLMVEHKIVDSPNAKKIKISEAKIEFKDVDFNYGEHKIFDKLNLTIQGKEKVGLVGFSGAGKSSLVNLLLRTSDVNGGGIFIDGQNIMLDITQRSLKSIISYIPQNPILFHRTIKENLLYGKLNATDEELIEATKKACCYDFIMEMDGNFDALVGERGGKLSGGQRQRIAIARAILKNAPILVLDEATSALDTLTEKEIQKALDVLMQNKSVIVVAHRLSTLDNMDKIIVLDSGKIVENDTKDELLKQNGLFKKMWDMQKDGVISN
ncbi:MAG: ABC transporter ATP-binding protein [Rickettsiales bacterium]|nr:MAG: ABC transporter ATP-binding protein [Rickettsiales bacterium]